MFQWLKDKFRKKPVVEEAPPFETVRPKERRYTVARLRERGYTTEQIRDLALHQFESATATSSSVRYCLQIIGDSKNAMEQVKRIHADAAEYRDEGNALLLELAEEERNKHGKV